jgi:hypothetical protein
MRIYNTKIHGFKDVKNYVLSDSERDNLKTILKILSKHMLQCLENGDKDFNKNDFKALNAIKNALHYKDGGKMLDWSSKQMKMIVILLHKLYGYPLNFTACYAFDFNMDVLNFYNRNEMYEEMERRRKILAEFQKEKENVKLLKENNKNYEKMMEERLINISASLLNVDD